jgi:hypothetical protein
MCYIKIPQGILLCPLSFSCIYFNIIKSNITKSEEYKFWSSTICNDIYYFLPTSLALSASVAFLRELQYWIRWNSMWLTYATWNTAVCYVLRIKARKLSSDVHFNISIIFIVYKIVMVASFSFLSVFASNRIQIQQSVLEPMESSRNIVMNFHLQHTSLCLVYSKVKRN